MVLTILCTPQKARKHVMVFFGSGWSVEGGNPHSGGALPPLSSHSSAPESIRYIVSGYCSKSYWANFLGKTGQSGQMGLIGSDWADWIWLGLAGSGWV